ncbi:copper resistance protein CopZ [Thermosipho melanesiensis]|uniref:Heavy metal transport/detoxification protein n=2 Tax=Thermosipho melanesiensis TaxID=46541 RepID=A6LKU8_THEM4|nr:heavy-metal-associated domain-containing protein [Thermosipho melanesiensis]ABR30549.1 Heavy metal transport/detoxification protein [Thermosipho melanesiensis BI429]APT73697.1 copper resistance protein CopZ [Thermosipho melanesiensis]OOC35636.1 copper resistance protein CopZ [Thermosipho melanesiensis]OOC39311.1 copper resistance protein CopZ [Thermosipho melanesiensis]OOC39397.1 copper resistance protein CopZ [Thermosipho melanesiensis]
MEKFELKVPNMSCHHCVMRITKALEELGEKNFKVKLEEKTVIIETSNLEKVKEKLSEIDYPVSEINKI